MFELCRGCPNIAKWLIGWEFSLFTALLNCLLTTILLKNKIEDPAAFAKGKSPRVFPKWLQCSLPSNCDFVILWQSFPRYWYAIKKIQSLSYSHLAIETTETLMLELLFCLKLATLPLRIKIICCTFVTFCDNVSSWNISI